MLDLEMHFKLLYKTENIFDKLELIEVETYKRKKMYKDIKYVIF